MGRRQAELTGKISYRLSKEEFQIAEREARDLGISVHEWCRRSAVEKLKNRNEIFNGPGEWEIYRLLAQARFLLGHGIRLIAEGKLTPQEWQKIRREADQSAGAIAADLLKKGKE